MPGKDYSKYEKDVKRCQRKCHADNSGKCYVPASKRINGVLTCGNHDEDKPTNNKRAFWVIDREEI